MTSETDDTEEEVYVVGPNGPHINTLILLHGTSQNGPVFGKSFLAPLSTTSSSLPANFPNTKFIFPTGAHRHSTVLSRHAHAWFDFESFADRTLGEHLSLPGIRESATYLASFVKKEVEVLRSKGGTGKVVLGGFSQGCAMGVMLLLSGELERAGVNLEQDIGGFVGLSGWLPFRRQLALSTVDSSHGSYSATQAHLRVMLELPPLENPGEEGKSVPVWLASGLEDEKVKLIWGLGMRDMLRDLGMQVRLEVYSIGHWWCEKEMEDLRDVLRGMFGERG